MDDENIRTTIASVGRFLSENNLVSAAEGNISARLDDGTILITETGCRLGEIDPGALAVLDGNGRALNDHRASSEAKMHVEIYRRRSDVSAIVHAHPRFSTGWAMARHELPWKSHPEVIVLLGHVALADYERPSTEALASQVAGALGEQTACLLANHGAVTVGPTLLVAQTRMEILESFAISSIVATVLGGPVDLPSKEIAALLASASDNRTAADE